MINKPLTYLSIIAVLFIFFSSCSKPKEVHSRKEMERIMYDIYIAEAMIESDYPTFGTPEKKEALIKQVFKKNKTNQARWDTSLAWYSDRVEIYLKMNDSVRARLNRKQKQLEALRNRELELERSITDRSVMTSNIPKQYSFREVNPINGFRFKLDNTQLKEMTDSLDISFSFDALGIHPNSIPLLTSQLILEYEDTTIYRCDSLLENKNYFTPIERYINTDTLRSIVGFIKLQDSLRIHKTIQLMNIKLGSSDSIFSINSNNSIKTEIKEINLDEDPIEMEKIKEID